MAYNPSPEELDADSKGQESLLANFDRLPAQYNGAGTFPRETLEALGFSFGNEVDDIFIKATPPEGWTLRATENVLQTEIIDADGRVRGSLFYKAWPLDRHAFFSLLS